MENILKDIASKYKNLGENPETYMKGLLQSKPLNYWDYIEVDTLLSLQKPRTDYEDEEIFIMYHQVTELVLKLMLHEIRQIVKIDNHTAEYLVIKFNRLNRYTSMLITSFDVMRDGMDYEQYNTFRTALAPASGFQSAQFRLIEIYCTTLPNLVNEEGKKRLPANPSVKDYFDHIYWKDAGTDRSTGAKTLTLRQFEEKYLEQFMTLAEKVNGGTLEEIISRTVLTDELRDTLRRFDYLYNVEWPLVHLNTAKHYLDKRGENQAATGGSQWKKYLHPRFQQRKFFPSLWTDTETGQWGHEEQKQASTL